MPPAARITDMHTCPMFTGPVPHVGGPILPPCCPTVIIGGIPAARVSDMCVCTGPPDAIAMGSPTVFIGSMMAARIGDPTIHGGVIVQGFPTVIIGNGGGSGGGGGSAAMGGGGQSGGTPGESGDGSPSADSGSSAGSGSSGSKPSAAAADKAVLDKFGDSIPASAKSPTAASATELQSDKDFKDGLKSRHPKIEDSYDIDQIYGESYNKKIFVNQDKNYAGTLYHEDIHHYSSEAFKKDFGTYKGVKVNEGVTEYFTRQVTTESRDGHYDTETQVAKKIADGVGEDTLKKAYFQGDPDSIKKVKDFLDK